MRSPRIERCIALIHCFQGDEALKTQTLDSGIENVAYTAPEVYMDGEYSTKSDIYSLGVVMWELALRIVKGNAARTSDNLFVY